MPDDAREGPGKGSMQAISRAAAVLAALAEATAAQSLGDLAARTGLPKTTVHRICGALEYVGYVRVDPDSGRRQLGQGLLRLAVLARRDLRSVLEPYLARLSRDLNETVDLAVLDDENVLFIAQHPAPQRELMAIARVGAHFPAYNIASGKVLLAQLPADELRRRLPGTFAPGPDGRPRTRQALLRELDDVRAGGLGYEREELRPGICAVAVAVRDADGGAASIAVPMPAARFAASEEAVSAALLRLRDHIEGELRRP
jgi:IclR family acetate operon transcriptional repressor